MVVFRSQVYCIYSFLNLQTSRYAKNGITLSLTLSHTSGFSGGHAAFRTFLTLGWSFQLALQHCPGFLQVSEMGRVLILLFDLFTYALIPESYTSLRILAIWVEAWESLIFLPGINNLYQAWNSGSIPSGRDL